MLSLCGIGFVTGASVSLLYLGSKIDALREQVVAVQQQITPAAPVSNSGGPSKPSPKNGRSGSGIKVKSQSRTEPAAAPASDKAEPPQ